MDDANTAAFFKMSIGAPEFKPQTSSSSLQGMVRRDSIVLLRVCLQPRQPSHSIIVVMMNEHRKTCVTCVGLRADSIGNVDLSVCI